MHSIQEVITAIELYEKHVITFEDLRSIVAEYYFRMYNITITDMFVAEPYGKSEPQA